MRVVFIGSSEFACPTLRILHKADYEIVAVYSRPAARGGARGLAPIDSPVAREAARLGLRLSTPRRWGDEEIRDFQALGADVGVVVSYGLLLPSAVWGALPAGCLNIHASLLPRWRGAAPIARAIEAGDRETGVCIMGIEAGLDTGPVFLSESTRIGAEECAGELEARLAGMGARLIVRALKGLEAGRLESRVQEGEGVYAAKVGKAELRLDWGEDARLLSRRVRAFSPRPGAWGEIGGRRVKILRARAVKSVEGKADMVCGEGALRLIEVQPAGGRVMSGEAFMRGIKR